MMRGLVLKDKDGNVVVRIGPDGLVVVRGEVRKP